MRTVLFSISYLFWKTLFFEPSVHDFEIYKTRSCFKLAKQTNLLKKCTIDIRMIDGGCLFYLVFKKYLLCFGDKGQ